MNTENHDVTTEKNLVELSNEIDSFVLFCADESGVKENVFIDLSKIASFVVSGAEGTSDDIKLYVKYTGNSKATYFLDNVKVCNDFTSKVHAYREWRKNNIVEAYGSEVMDGMKDEVASFVKLAVDNAVDQAVSTIKESIQVAFSEFQKDTLNEVAKVQGELEKHNKKIIESNDIAQSKAEQILSKAESINNVFESFESKIITFIDVVDSLAPACEAVQDNDEKMTAELESDSLSN